MRRATLFSLALLVFPAAVAQQPPATLTGNWVITADYFGTPIYWPLHLTDTNGKLTGDLDGDKLEGTVTNGHVHFLAKDPRGGFEDVDATLTGNTLTGAVNYLEVDDPPSAPAKHALTAVFQPALPAGRTPQRHEFVPTTFYKQFSYATTPVLHVWPGDTIHTTTVDAGGFDEDNAHRSMGGNPETGPFYIESAMPGDTLVVHVLHLKPNRDTAISDDNLVGRAQTSDLAQQMKGTGKNVTWKLDLARGVATTTAPGSHLKHYTVNFRPMLGCVATAPRPSSVPQTGDSGGSFGGNMDFNEIVDGVTLYLPVSMPGALLYFGDAHAAQGDGELNGNALETSMDVELSVDVIHKKRIEAVRLENETHIMAMGLAGSLDAAFAEATENMAQWLQSEYKLDLSEIAQVLGTAAEYRISEVADRNAGIVLKLRKDRLATIEQHAAEKAPTRDPTVPEIHPQ